ncbi:aldo/keto reductase [Bauldia sp.]|uniref:aldo/keto reductase n=1 Tax=Bauldia sp. TaxID=2575872 RepID=UPI003BAB2DB3
MTVVLLDRKTQVGGTDVWVPPICFGTSGLGDMPKTYGYGVDEERALATIRAVFDGPIKFLDTSRNYGMGRSETRIGKVIREYGGLPPGAVISTKLDRDMETGRFDAAQARRSLEETLEALGLDRVQILHLHDPEHAESVPEIVGPGGALPELFKMKEEGLANAVGLAAGKVDIMMPILTDWDFDALITHNRYTLVSKNAEPMMDLARQRNISVFNAAPFAGGALAKGATVMPRYVYQEANEATLAPIRRVEAVCERHGVPSGAAALQFSLRNAEIATTICGVSKAERIDQTIEWAEWDIPESLWAELAEVPREPADPEAARQYDPG